MANRPVPRWLRSCARWVITDELRAHTADLAAARTIARITTEERDALRTELVVNLRFMAARGRAHPCLDVPLYTDRQIADRMERIRVFTGDPCPLESYRCATCPRHPYLGIARHIRPVVHIPIAEAPPLVDMPTAQLPAVVDIDDLTPFEDAVADRVALNLGGGAPRHGLVDQDQR